MRKRSPAVAGSLLTLALAAGLWAARPAAPAAGEDAPAPVLVELFTSQGCSSCPPADDLLRTLERNQPVAGALVIPLSEHVDYWNRLGWRDPFSSRRFSERQREYAESTESIGIDALYTPMMVIDGDTAIIGSRPIAAREAILAARKAPKARLDVAASVPPGGADAHVTGVITELPPADAQAEVWVAVAESGLSTDVTRGENADRTLAHNRRRPQPQPGSARCRARRPRPGPSTRGCGWDAPGGATICAWWCSSRPGPAAPYWARVGTPLVISAAGRRCIPAGRRLQSTACK